MHADNPIPRRARTVTVTQNVRIEPMNQAEPRWPAGRALFTSWLMPATTARRTNHVPLHQAYAIHLLALCLGAILWLLLNAWDLSFGPDGLLWVGIRNTLSGILETFERDPASAWSATAGIVLGIELGFLSLALLATPWGARDERMRDSIAAALRRTWLQTPFVSVAILLAGPPFVWLDHAGQAWTGATQPPTPTALTQPAPARPSTKDPSATKAWQQAHAQWQAQQKAYAEALSGWWEGRPWYVKHAEEIIVICCLLLIAWFVWTVFRSMSAPRTTPSPNRPPLCEACGYNLTGNDVNGRCPECGEAILLSLGPHVRPGTPWQQRGGGRKWSEAWRCTLDGLRRPAWLGRQMQLPPRGPDHRPILVRCLPIFFLAGAAGLLGAYVTSTARSPLQEPEVVYLLAPLVGCLATALLSACPLVASWAAALYYRAVGERNLLAAAMQMACCLAGYLVLWALSAPTVGILIIANRDLFDRIKSVSPFDRALLMFGTWVVFNALCFLAYVALVRAGTAGARWANDEETRRPAQTDSPTITARPADCET
jgi:hypothetical protein